METAATDDSRDTTPLISVVVPFYNIEECVADCLDSLVNQTFDSYEVVWIDDGSTDGTGRLLDAYADRHANVRVFHFENAGLSVARNRGVEHAQAELISFVDGDDFVSPHYLSALYKAYDNVPGRMVQAKRITGKHEKLKSADCLRQLCHVLTPTLLKRFAPPFKNLANLFSDTVSVETSHTIPTWHTGHEAILNCPAAVLELPRSVPAA